MEKRKISSILFGSAFFALIIVLAYTVPMALAAGGVNSGSQLKSGASPSAPTAQNDIAGPSGSGAFGTSVTVLPNGNFVVTDPFYDAPGPVADVGAVYLYNANTLALISKLTGSTASDQVGGDGITVLTNGNFVVRSHLWNNVAITDTGAITWCSATAGCAGTVSSANSLVGSTQNDQVVSVTPLTNGNYVAGSTLWDGGSIVNVGAMRWCSGTTGCQGTLSLFNSLVGTTAGDSIGSVTALSNGNYVVRSQVWTNPGSGNANAGSATWCSGTAGCVGTVGSNAGLVGSAVNDSVSSGGVITLTNGNYVVGSPIWNNVAIADAGAATWCDGTTGCGGTVSSANSLVGGTASDTVGNTITALTNGNYVVNAPFWNNPVGPVVDVGAVTWCDGTTGCTAGLVTTANSLSGTTTNDRVGSGGSTPLFNGNYAVSSPHWIGGGNVDSGAVTFCSGTTGCGSTFPTVSNSLIGLTAGDAVGTVTPLQVGGNYAVSSPSWTNGIHTGAGAVTRCSGTLGCTGAVAIGNSLVGSTTSDNVGSVTALANGSYVVRSPSWDDFSVPTIDVGAVTWCPVAGCTGAVSSSNSLVGTTAFDQVGGDGVTALTNGNFVVRSQFWDDWTAVVADVGAATWCSGTLGCTGVISSTNSLIGGTAFDGVGRNGVTATTIGHYVVSSSIWDNPTGPKVDAGAVTWGNGTSGTVGLVTPTNSLVGGTASDNVGNGPVLALTGGKYSVFSVNWDNPAGLVVNARALTLGDNNGGTFGLITSSNSVLGTVLSGVNASGYDPPRSRLVVGRSASNIVSLFPQTILRLFFPLLVR